MKCLVCNHRLNRREEWKGGELIAEVYEHAYRHDHIAVPVSETQGGYLTTPVCDFCGNENPPGVTVVTEPFMMTVSGSGEVEHRMDSGEWDLCAVCQPVFDPDDLDPIIDRVRGEMKKTGRFPDSVVDEYIETMIIPIYHRIGRNFIRYDPFINEDLDEKEGAP